jgi:hypothetical protein
MLKKLIFIAVLLSFAFAVSAGQFKIARINGGDTTVKTDKDDKPVKIVKPKTKKEKPDESFYQKVNKYFPRTPFITGEDLYWFFSTLAQTLGAIVGVVGMLTVFRLQNLTTSMQRHLDATHIQRNNIFGGEKAFNQTPEDVINDFTKKYPDFDLTKFKSESSVSILYYGYQQILKLFNTFKKIRYRFLRVFLPFQLLAIFSSLALLPFSRNLVSTIDSQFIMYFSISVTLVYLFLSTMNMIIVLMKAEFINSK